MHNAQRSRIHTTRDCPPINRHSHATATAYHTRMSWSEEWLLRWVVTPLHGSIAQMTSFFLSLFRETRHRGKTTLSRHQTHMMDTLFQILLIVMLAFFAGLFLYKMFRLMASPQNGNAHSAKTPSPTAETPSPTAETPSPMYTTAYDVS